MDGIMATAGKVPQSADEWDAKYKAAACDYFDWYLSSAELQPHLQTILDRYDASCEIFVPGCGMSELAFHLYEMGYEHVTNADTSAMAIQRMAREQDRRRATAMECVVLDAINMPDVPDQCFDVVVDKGLLDTVLCGANNIENAVALVHELHRVLKVNGTFVLISHGPPDTRLHYLTRETLEWTVHPPTPIERAGRDGCMTSLGTPRLCYMYTCHRQLL
ncbi:hypothetical protein H310_13292 [Aphanomyces invadans]|uniref:Methyltransferase domain-containing protein n=1 Tax=Aphanomyces invadans TaxID=157072 RepID=A0A024TEJ3_9STRA|nr:hypothetical protein H310_13292 [Aphanomyces invadans]ETV92404.1 hypothetical protein H310_13292 [Aphanomyces invadans]|eukprot:XP_008878955.1 hypothetical protein H310_13292 [Aphanomyces invadans]